MTDTSHDIQAFQRINELQAEIEAIKKVVAPSGGGSHDTRLARLEVSVDHIQKDIGEVKDDLRTLRSDAKIDFRLLFGALIAVALGLAALMAKGFHWL